MSDVHFAIARSASLDVRVKKRISRNRRLSSATEGGAGMSCRKVAVVVVKSETEKRVEAKTEIRLRPTRWDHEDSIRHWKIFSSTSAALFGV